jgi:hypothetical protein
MSLTSPTTTAPTTRQHELHAVVTQDTVMATGLLVGLTQPDNPLNTPMVLTDTALDQQLDWLDLPQEGPQWVDLPSPDRPTGLRCPHPVELLFVWRQGADLLIATPRSRVRVIGHFLHESGGLVCLMANHQPVDRDALALLCIAAERYARARRVRLASVDDFLHEDDLVRLYATTWPPLAG